MNIVCLDMEGVLVPEIWIAFSEASGIPALRRTTRDEPDYDKLMHYRMDILREHGLGLKEIKDAREQFVAAYNGFFSPKIASAKAALDETKEKIRQLPGLSRFYHSFCTPLMGILTAALFAVGLVPILTMEKYSFGVNINTLIAVVGAVLFIAWIVTTILWIINGASARQLYKAAERQVGEVRTYRGKLKS